MDMFRKLAVSGLASAALLVPAINAQAAPTGDTCTYTGTGTTFVLNITVPQSAPGEGGFAFGGSGITIVNINIHNYSGSPSSSGLPPSTTLEELLNSQIMPGTLVIDITTSGPFSGSFNVVPANYPPSMYFDPFSCPLVGGGTNTVTVVNNTFTVEPTAVYDPVTNRWYLTTGVPGPGIVVFHDPPAVVDAAPPVKSGRVVVKKAGKIKLPLVLTAAGKTALAKSGSVKVHLTVTFTPTGGKAATKKVTLTLRKK